MAAIMKTACAGTLESSDIFVEISPAEGIEIELESLVEQQFGSTIQASAEEILLQYGITDAKLTLRDRGALDCVIRARVETAIRRGLEG